MPSYKNPLCCYYPTSVFMVDDDPIFLNALAMGLGISTLKLFHSPQAVLAGMPKTGVENRINCLLLSNPELDDYAKPSAEKRLLQVDIHRIHELIYDPARYEDVSVLVTDYHMPEMTGIELCERLKDVPVKKILLTAVTDESLAIRAFNEGIIDQFINKNSDNLVQKVAQAVVRFQNETFVDFNAKIASYLNQEGCIRRLEFQRFFASLCDRYAIAEYYLFDQSGSFLLFDDKVQPMWLIVKSDEQIADYEHLAEDYEASGEMIRQLKTRSLLPFFFSEQDYEQPVQNWENYLFPAMPIPECPGFYYSLIEGDGQGRLDKTRLCLNKL